MKHLRHDIVNVLYTIKGLADTHLDRIGEDYLRSMERRLQHAEDVLRRIYIQTEKALDITKKMGMYLRVGALKGSVSRTACVKKNWEFTLKSLAAEFDLEGVEIMDRIPPDFPQVGCGASDLREIFYLLASNAIHAMRETHPSECKLVIRAEYAFTTREEPFAVITLVDTGPGIDPARLPHLFQPFYTTKPAGQGNGLGLYLVHELVMRNKGRILVTSIQGKGTAFSLELRLARTVQPV